MNKIRIALITNLVIFFIILLIHLARIFTGFYIQVGDLIIPRALNIVFAIISLLVLILNFRALRSITKK